MEKQFFFFNMSYEQISHIPGTFFRTFFISIGYAGMHWHNEMELILVLDGTVTLRNSEKPQTLKKGDLFWVNQSEIHSLLETEEDNLLLVLQIDPEAVNRVCPEFTAYHYHLTPEKPLPVKDTKAVKWAMAQILKLSEERNEGYSLFCVEMVYAILGRIISKATKKDIPASRGLEGLASVRIKQIVKYLNEHFRDPLSLKDLSDQFQLSPYHISHIIHSQTGFTFQEHLNFIRLHYAIDLMMTTGLRLIDISMESGFSDPKYLNKYFHRLFGIKPSEMRKKENWKEIIKNRFGRGTTNLAVYGAYLNQLMAGNFIISGNE